MSVMQVRHPVVAGAMLLSATMAIATPAQAPRLTALVDVRPGQWQLHEAGGETRSVCVRDPAALFQLRGNGAQCSRFIVENGATSASVHYTCPGRGHGRTTITVETGRLIQIESEGIDGGAPFSLAVEGRRIGECRGG